MTDSQAHLRIVRVDVEDGSVDDPAHVSAVRAGAGVAGVSREPDLEHRDWLTYWPIRRQYLLDKPIREQYCVYQSVL